MCVESLDKSACSPKDSIRLTRPIAVLWIAYPCILLAYPSDFENHSTDFESPGVD